MTPGACRAHIRQTVNNRGGKDVPCRLRLWPGLTARRRADLLAAEKNQGGRLMAQFGKLVLRVATVSLLAAVWAGAARAEPVKIGAIGSSNTNGVGVGAAKAWPAHLRQV